MRTRIIAFVAGIAASALMGSVATADEHRMKVVTTFTVLADMAENVAGEAAEVVSVTKPGAEIHGYEPTPRDLVGAQDADLILWNGMNLELWFEQFLRNLGDVPSVTLTDGIEPIPIAEGAYEGKPNPHAWMGLDNAIVYIDNIAAAFAQHDPDNAATYEANAAAYKDELRATLEPLRETVAEIAEDHRLNGDRRAPLGRDVVEAAECDRSGIHPALHDGAHGAPKLVERILREFLFHLVEDRLLEGVDQVAPVGRRQLVDGLLRHFVGDVLEDRGIGIHDEAGIVLNKALAGAVGENETSCRLSQSLRTFIVEAEIEDRVEHARHGFARTGPHRDEKRFCLAAKGLAGQSFERF